MWHSFFLMETEGKRRVSKDKESNHHSRNHHKNRTNTTATRERQWISLETCEAAAAKNTSLTSRTLVDVVHSIRHNTCHCVVTIHNHNDLGHTPITIHNHINNK